MFRKKMKFWRKGYGMDNDILKLMDEGKSEVCGMDGNTLKVTGPRS